MNFNIKPKYTERAKREPFILDIIIFIIFLISFKFAVYNNMRLLLVIPFILQMTKMLLLNRDIFNFQGVVACNLLLFYAFLIFNILGGDTGERFLISSISMLLLNTGLLNYKKVIKPYYLAKPVEAPKPPENLEDIEEVETSIFYPSEEDEKVLDNIIETDQTDTNQTDTDVYNTDIYKNIKL